MLTVVLAHYGGIDEMAIVIVPVVLAGGLWYVMRGGDPKDEPPEETR